MARQQGDVDELFDVRNAFYIGNFQQCINEAQKLKVSSPALQIERDAYLYRAYISQRKYRVVIDEINVSSPPELQPLKVLADYFGNKSKRPSIISKLDEQTSGNIDPKNINFIIVAATIYSEEDNYDSALRILHNTDHLECSALMLQIYLRMNRVDLAQKELKSMQEKDDDATLTQLAQAWVNVSAGGEKLQEAYYIFQEMCDKYGSTPTLLNGQAVCFIGMGKLEEAESALQEALEKDSNNPDTLINMIVVSELTAKPEEVSSRYVSQMKDSHADHPFVKDLLEKENEFDCLAKQYAQEYAVAS